MATAEEMKRQSDEFAAAFAEDTPAKPELSEDEAFGLTPEEPAQEMVQEEAAESVPEAASQPEMPEEGGESAPEQAMQEAEAAAEGDSSEGAPAVAVVIAPEADDEGVGEEPEMDEKDRQREKTWEGRLRAREAELKAREEALAAREKAPMQPAQEAAQEAAEGESPAEESAEAPFEEAAEAVLEKIDAGEKSLDEIEKIIAEDFGDEFANNMKTWMTAKAREVAAQMAEEKVSAVDQKIEGLREAVSQDRAQNHFEMISDEHPDFMDIASSQEFKDYIEAMPDDQKASAMAVIENGSARKICSLLNTYKASSKQEAQPEPMKDDPAADAAEGVRSSGAAMRLPEQPKKAGGYEEAWDEF